MKNECTSKCYEMGFLVIVSGDLVFRKCERINWICVTMASNASPIFHWSKIINMHKWNGFQFCLLFTWCTVRKHTHIFTLVLYLSIKCKILWIERAVPFCVMVSVSIGQKTNTLSITPALAPITISMVNNIVLQALLLLLCRCRIAECANKVFAPVRFICQIKQHTTMTGGNVPTSS